ncbi:MAG: protein-L-isoaspartate O-methyltransferase [Alphaproteobacteria bacterium]|nr:protein-L-isoaspartate O-methyltransferase [Alphaproteobacteria bacterium]MBU1525686.1 protein-L-isoaspartate O-methyltransferase [Alphaproteobacteria bacterium]MBU2118334.1 protein-L-isoaspartate O-methyltransferase [Alphaproteobacteria bacterium]MBU2351933.1 protein-L-isoaspartate O-methyltransferase [Alphaproteobacteria bacterium]MBU2383710.1 protein-L-isoaspartate O-methyltransferase [Alphaproteobacteria bacterium]
MDMTAARKAMVDSQVRVNDVTDRALQAALLAVPREKFCAPGREFSAYAEVEVEIAAGRSLMEVREVAKMLQFAVPRDGETALAIAGPYAAAVLARMGLKVTAQEADPAVFDVVGAVLQEQGVETVVGPLTHPHVGEWDLIVSEGGVATRPDAWLDALKPGGRAVFVERDGRVGRAVLYVRGEQGLSRRELFDAAPPVLDALRPAPAFAL